ncbi:MAG: TIM barrel protein, partial [Candidatus Pacearchaeota archaeon]
GPYFINLNSLEKNKKQASLKRILETARIANLCGASTITFHAAYYMKMKKEEVYSVVKKEIKEIVEVLNSEKNKVWVRPELTGKETQWGDLQELIRLSQEVEQVLPCIDFSHMHARYNGKYNSYDEFRSILVKLERELGKEIIDNMHIHISGINYSAKGEKNHLILKESDLNYIELMKALKDFKVKGLVICESPNLEKDAQLLKKTFAEV